MWFSSNTIRTIELTCANRLERLRDFLDRFGVLAGVSKLSVPLSPAALLYPTPRLSLSVYSACVAII